jgi:hypothetical protein
MIGVLFKSLQTHINRSISRILVKDHNPTVESKKDEGYRDCAF